ncbi:uncharacterized protein LOC127257714 [Andrographis paniculata]|uniref:uncharacterized protein LOC127257714 n=1 Tax=Andrographis paniculata TaxID=175694 RepID=UPI0021E93F8C|nr:uncharacterized protein LOC127257714 [Andrographis paniculata]
MYYCLAALREGFKACCRTIIGLDGCFLKGIYNGQLLTAIGRDPNENIYPIAFVFVEIEKFETWDWFLEHLMRDMGDSRTGECSFKSDCQKGLVEAIAERAPRAEHRFYLRNMYNNFKVRFKGLELKRLFWKAVSTFNLKEHEKVLRQIHRYDVATGTEETAYAWLSEISQQHWALAFFRKASRNCFPSWGGDNKYEVMHFTQNHVVELNQHMCTYDMFQIRGYPCCYGVPVIEYQRLTVENFVDAYFKKETYMTVYTHAINPVPGIHEYEESMLGEVAPPVVKVRTGRPKKARRRDGNDERQDGKAS